MTHGSLFSGIGGFELAARWCGFTNVFSCEIEPFNRRVLHHHFPESELHDDIKEMDATHYYGRVDIISGGFPCQPYSVAGKRLGKEDERHLWPEMLRIIREVAPTYVVGENVRGLVNWSEGMVFEEVCADLEVAGYDVQPFILPAASVGAPHRRDRVWFVAHSNHQRTGAGFGQVQSADAEISQRNDDAESCNSGGGFVAHPENVRLRKTEGIGRKRREQKPDNRSEIRDSPDPNGEGGDVTNTQRDGLEYSTERRGVGQSEGKTRECVAGHATAEGWAGFPTQPPVCGGNDGIPRELDGITFPKWRANSIKAYGNAIVPQVAYQIFDTIRQMESTK
jgi:DNA (cytosine-5)-methyltransferase 1